MSAHGAPSRYRVRDGDASRDRDAVLAVWHGNLGEDARMADKYDWFYGRAPAGPPLLQVLLDDSDTIIGVCAAGRRRMLQAGNPLSAGVLVDLAVLPEHRSLGPAMMLQQGVFAAGRRELGMLYGFPNPKAAPVFKRVGYRPLADMVRYVRVLRHAPYLRRKLPAVAAAPAGWLIDRWLRLRDRMRYPQSRRLHATWHERVPDIEPLWTASPKPEAITALRSADALSWRFDDAPNAHFTHLLLRDGGTAVAWFAMQRNDKTLHIHDAWFRDGGATPEVSVLAAMRDVAYRAGAAAVSVELATNAERLRPWLAFGFVERSRRPLFGAWRAPDNDDTGTPDVHLMSADEDE